MLTDIGGEVAITKSGRKKTEKQKEDEEKEEKKEKEKEKIYRGRNMTWKEVDALLHLVRQKEKRKKKKIIINVSI